MLSFYLNLALSDEERNIVEILYKDHYINMFHIALKLTNNNDIAADIVHEAMLKIINFIDTNGIDNIKSLKAYAMVAVRHTAVDHIRARSSSKTIDENDLSEHWDIVDPELSPIDVAISNDSFKSLIGYIHALPDTYRDACYLKYACDLDEKEIADILHISASAVTMRIHRGRKILQKNIEVQSRERQI